MALPLLHSYTRNESRDAILGGKYTNMRIHGINGNMVRVPVLASFSSLLLRLTTGVWRCARFYSSAQNPFQPWATLKQALVVDKGDSDSSNLMKFSVHMY